MPPRPTRHRISLYVMIDGSFDTRSWLTPGNRLESRKFPGAQASGKWLSEQSGINTDT